MITWLAEKCLKWRGWRFVGDLPDVDKMIIIGAPHTSNWDFIIYLGAVRHWDMEPRFVGKHTLFRWPFGYFFKAMGGIPVDRSSPGGIVGQVAEAFDRSERMILVMAPEGTRREAPFWRSGFARIAAEARVPIVPARVDFPGKRVDLGAPIEVDGDEKGLMDQLRDYYRPGVGKDGRGKGPIRLKDEGSV